MEVSWSELKSVVDARALSIQWAELSSNYYLAVMDGAFQLESMVPIDPLNVDTADFIANYKAKGNLSPTSRVLNTSAGRYTAGVNPFSRLQVSPEPSEVFMDKFEGSLDTAIKWSTITVGTATAPVAGGSLNISGGTTTGNVSAISSQPVFTQRANVQLSYAVVLKFEANNAKVTGAHRFWGVGTAASNTVSAPLTDAIGYEIDTSGGVNAVVYASGVKIFTFNTGSVNDGANHRYSFVWRTDRVAFYVDSTDGPITVADNKVPSVQMLPVRFHAIVGAGTSATPTLQVTSVGLSDTGKNSSAIADGTNPFRRAAVNEFGELATNHGNQSFSRVTGNGTTLVKSGTGVLYGVIINNAATNGVMTLYDSLTGTGTVITALNVGTPSGGLLSTSGFPNPIFIGPLSIRFNTGLTAVRTNSSNNDFTLIFR